jgi:hypothetical protein
MQVGKVNYVIWLWQLLAIPILKDSTSQRRDTSLSVKLFIMLSRRYWYQGTFYTVQTWDNSRYDHESRMYGFCFLCTHTKVIWLSYTWTGVNGELFWSWLNSQFLVEWQSLNKNKNCAFILDVQKPSTEKHYLEFGTTGCFGIKGSK